MSVIDSRVKKRKFWKSFKNIIFGKNIFQVFFRIYLLTILVGAIFLYTPLTHSDWNIKIMGYEREYTLEEKLHEEKTLNYLVNKLIERYDKVKRGKIELSNF